MRRKVIQLAGKTLVVSLPSKWARKCGISKGDELDVEERDKTLVLSSESEQAPEKITIDVTKMNERVIRWVFSAVHKSGYDEIEIIYDDPEVIRLTDEVVKNLFLGFVIIEQTEKRCVLRSVSKDQEAEFDAALRRAFLVTLSMGESVVEYLRKGNFKGLNELLTLERTNNQLTNFCERIIIKKGHRNYKKNCFFYVIAWNLEKVCDNYKYICNFLSGSITPVKKELLGIFERANSLLRAYYTLYCKFSIETLVELSEQKASIEADARKLFRKASGTESVILSLLISVLNETTDFSASFFAINQQTQEPGVQ